MIALDAVLASVRDVTGRVFHPRDVRAREREHAWVIELGDEMIAFVATNPESRARLLQTRRVLARIGPRLTFEVPRPLGPIERVEPCDLRTRTKGAVGIQFRERVRSDDSHALRVGTWIGGALAELHGALAGLELDGFGLALPSWPPSGARLAACATFAHDVVMATDICARWDRKLADRNLRGDVLVHGDVDLHNFGFDPETSMPVSLFDFHEAGRGPRMLDLAAIPDWGSPALGGVLARYTRDVSITSADVHLAHAVRAIAGLGPEASEERLAAVRLAVVACSSAVT